MPENTPRLGLPKPTGNENVTRVNYNELIDAVDAAAAKKEDVDTHLADNTKHITATERTNWNAKETPSEAQAKVDTHAADNVKHITAAERTAWNSKANGTHTHAAADITESTTRRFVSDTEKATWNGKQNALNYELRINSGRLEYLDGGTWKEVGKMETTRNHIFTKNAVGSSVDPVEDLVFNLSGSGTFMWGQITSSNISGGVNINRVYIEIDGIIVFDSTSPYGLSPNSTIHLTRQNWIGVPSDFSLTELRYPFKNSVKVYITSRTNWTGGPSDWYTFRCTYGIV